MCMIQQTTPAADETLGAEYEVWATGLEAVQSQDDGLAVDAEWFAVPEGTDPALWPHDFAF